MDQAARAEAFARLHQRNNPVVIFNAWDAGSAKSIMAAGAKAIATGDHPVGFSHGFGDDDFDDFTYEAYFQTIKEIAHRTGDIPFSVDISNAPRLDHSQLTERIVQLLNVGVVGINFEDRAEQGGLRSAEEHAERIAVIRAAADEQSIPLFINARSDIFAENQSDSHENLINEAVQRAQHYADAGANGFFAPGLFDIGLIKRLAESIALPLNIIRLPGAPSAAELVEAGVSRISYGPVPQMRMSEWLQEQARAAFALQD